LPRRRSKTRISTSGSRAQNALLVGIARETFKKDLGAGDFLIRQVIGVSVKDGGLVIGDKVKPGQRFRFHVRDRESAMTEAESLFSGQLRQFQYPNSESFLIICSSSP